MRAILAGLRVSQNKFLKLNEARRELLKLQRVTEDESERNNLGDTVDALESLDDLFYVTIDSLGNIEGDD